MPLSKISPGRKLIGRRAGTALLGVAALMGMATVPGCDTSGGVHTVDPAGAAKTLVDENAPQPTKTSSNKKLQKRIEQEQQEIAKHPKVR